MGGRLGGSTKSNSITSMFKFLFDPPPPSPLRILAQNFLCEMAFRDPAGQLNMLNNIICLVRPEIDPDGKT